MKLYNELYEFVYLIYLLENETKREITKYINRRQFTKGTRGKPNEQQNIIVYHHVV